MTGRRGWDPVDETGLTVTVLERRAGLCLRGQAAVLGVGALREAIAALPADVAEVHLELAELHRCVQHPGTDRPGPPPGAALPDLASATAQPDPPDRPAMAGLPPDPGAIVQQDRR